MRQVILTSLPARSGRRQRWATSRAISMFMWMKRPVFNILKKANRMSVARMNPIKMKEANLVTMIAVDLAPGDRLGSALGASVGGGGEMQRPPSMIMPIWQTHVKLGEAAVL